MTGQLDKRIQIVFFGNSQYSARLLQKLAGNSSYNITAVLTRQDKKQGRNLKLQPSPVKALARKLHIPVFTEKETKKNFLEFLRRVQPRLGILYDFGHILSKDIIESFPLGILNIHPSLLPKYRGPNPIFWTIYNGDRESGISVIRINEKVDWGKIVFQEKIRISSEDNFLSLKEKLTSLGEKFLEKMLPLYIEGGIEPTPQNPRNSSYAPKVAKTESRLDWRSSSVKLARHIRAFFPHAFTYWNGKRIQILQACETKLSPREEQIKPGRIFLQGDQVCVKCGRGALRLIKIKREGKKETSAQSFLNGHPDLAGSFFK